MDKFLELISDIQFTTVDEFYEKREYIKQKYNKLDVGSKEIYKWYFYFQFCLLKNPLKEMLWTYLNHEEYIFEEQMKIQYNIFCSKRKIQKIIESQFDNLEE